MTKEQHDDSIVLTEPEAETTPASSDTIGEQGSCSRPEVKEEVNTQFDVLNDNGDQLGEGRISQICAPEDLRLDINNQHRGRVGTNCDCLY